MAHPQNQVTNPLHVAIIIGLGVIVLPVVLLIAVACLAALGILGPAKEHDPPRKLVASSVRTIERVHEVLNAGPVTGKYAEELPDPGVDIYCFIGPEDDHPGRILEYHVGLYQSRWHANIVPQRRLTLDGKVYELWRVRYGGNGRWYGVLREHQYCYVTVADDLWSRRTILDRMDIAEWPNEQIPFDSVKLPDGTQLEFPPQERIKTAKGVGAD